MSDYKIPWDELSGESNLEGTYKVTFLVNISNEDNMNIDDLRQTIASSLAGDPVLEKTAKLDLEKTDNQGNPLQNVKAFEVGDLVILKEDVVVTADIDRHESLFIVGAKSLGVEKIGEGTIVIPQGATARINSIDGENVELIEFSSLAEASYQNQETGEREDITVNVDTVIFSDKYIEHYSEEEKIWP